jgi:AbrB family looped-hinge helix DNA binding protein
MKTTVSSKGQIVLPAEFRQMDRIEPGQEFDVERLDRGDYRLVRRALRERGRHRLAARLSAEGLLRAHRL